MGDTLPLHTKAGKARPALYLPKRSTVLVLCFLACTFASAQHFIMDGIMQTLLRDDVVGELLKYDEWQLMLAIYIGLALSPVIFGVFLVLSGRAKLVLVSGLVLSSFATLVTPSRFAIGVDEGIIARTVVGIGHGMMLVSFYSIISHWVPRQEYTRAVTFVASGYFAGMLTSDLWTSILIETGSWRTPFTYFGLVPLLFAALFAYVVRNNPADHSTITQSELTYIRANAAPFKPHDLAIGSLLKTKEVWAAVLAWMCVKVVTESLVHTLPFFFVEVVWSDISFAALIMVLVFGNITAMILDFIIHTDRTSPLGYGQNVRRATGTGGMLGCAILLRYFCTGGHAPTVRILGYSAAFICLLVSFAGAPSGILDIAPKQAPLLVGIAALPAAILSACSTIGLRWVLDSTGSWQFVFSANGILLCLGGLIWCLWGSSERHV